jgi:pimeloyl-ACP methyl ester carboxylesterase
MPLIQTNEISLYYEVHGEGFPLLLIASVGYDHQFWRHQVEGLSPFYQVIVFDNRGAGRSDKPEGPYYVWQMADDTASLMNALSIPKAHVAGHALGGSIAQELALNYPGLVDRLILASSTFGGPGAVPVTPHAVEVLARHEGDQESLIREEIGVMTAPGFAESAPDCFEEIVAYRSVLSVIKDSYQYQVLAGVQHDTADRLHRLDTLTLVMTGEFDEVTPPGNAHLLASTLPNAGAFILPGVGHIFPLEAPELTNKVLLEFLNM